MVMHLRHFFLSIRRVINPITTRFSSSPAHLQLASFHCCLASPPAPNTLARVLHACVCCMVTISHTQHFYKHCAPSKLDVLIYSSFIGPSLVQCGSCYPSCISVIANTCRQLKPITIARQDSPISSASNMFRQNLTKFMLMLLNADLLIFLTVYVKIRAQESSYHLYMRECGSC